MNYSKTLDGMFKKMNKIVEAEKREKMVAERWEGVKLGNRTSVNLQENLFADMYKLSNQDAVIMLNSISRAEEKTIEESHYMDRNSVELEESRNSVRTLNRLGKMLSIVNANNMIGLVEDTAVLDINVEDITEEQLRQDTERRVEVLSMIAGINDRALSVVKDCVASEKEVAIASEGTQSEVVARACDIVDGYITRQMDRNSENAMDNE